MPRLRPIPLALVLGPVMSLAACAEFPALDATLSPELVGAPPPALVPLGPVIAEARAIPATAQATPANLSSRLAALRARAAGLRGPVIPPAARNRMLRAMR